MAKATKPLVLTPGYNSRAAMAGDLEFRALRMDWDQHVGLLITHLAPGRYGERKLSVATSIAFEVVPPEAEGKEWPVDPTIKLRQGEAQQLMEALWNAGLRPSQYVDDNERAALSRHLDDMRTIVGAALDVNLAITKNGRRQ